MKRWVVGVTVGVGAGLLLAIVACSNSDTSSPACPDESIVGSGAACTTAAQTCAGSVDVGACGGQAANIAEYECTCTSGKWVCPQPAAPICPADGGGDGAPNTDGAMNDAAGDGAEGSTTGDGGSDALEDAPADVELDTTADEDAADGAGE